VLKVASAVLALSRLLKVQVALVVPLPDTVPLQVVQETVDPALAVAVKTTSVPWSKFALPVLLAG
jgi:hypothetical protein